MKETADHPDHNLLLEIRELVSQLVWEVEKILNGNRNIDKGNQIIQAISLKEREYRLRLLNLEKQLNLQPGHEHDCLKVVDIFGKSWNYGVL